MSNMTDYAAERASYRWSAPKKFNFARDVLDVWAEKDPAHLALWWSTITVRK